MLTSDDCDVM